jgi:CRP-like cAMP-binding protein
MTGQHFTQFKTVNATDSGILSSLEEGPWGRIYNFDEIRIIAKYMSAYRLPKGSLLFEQGDRRSFVCFVVSGSVEVFKEDEFGKEKKLILIKSGKSLGEMSLVDHEPRSATCRVAEEAVLLILDKENLEALEESHPHVAFSFVRYLAMEISRRLRKTTGTLMRTVDSTDPMML